MTSDQKQEQAGYIESLRPLLRTYSYNICGSVEEAEDIVQDVFLKFWTIDLSKVTDVKNYLIRMVINRSINQKKRMQKLRPDYPGEWLPEPVASERADMHLISKDLLSYSMMVLLEKLNARQRAVFILKEAFDYEHTEIADVLGITTELSRQLLSRAKKQLGTEHVKEQKIPENFLSRFLSVIQAGDTARLEELLNDDIVLVSDGGGKVSAAINPLFGKSPASAFMSGVHNKFHKLFTIEQGLVNGQPALLYLDNGILINCQVFSLIDGRINGVYFIRNPDKLRFFKLT